MPASQLYGASRMPRSTTGQQQYPRTPGISNTMYQGMSQQQQPQQKQYGGTQQTQQPTFSTGTYTQSIPNSPNLGTPQDFTQMYSQSMANQPQQGYMGDLMRQQGSQATIGLLRSIAPAINQMNSAYQEASANEGLANQAFMLNRLQSDLGFRGGQQNFLLSQIMRALFGG